MCLVLSLLPDDTEDVAIDREAVAQLRVLLRGDHGLTMAQEEELIATYLAGKTLSPAIQNTVTSTATLAESGWGVALLQAPVIEAEMVGIAAIVSLAMAWGSGDALFQGAYSAHPLAAALAGMLGILLLALFPLRAWYGRRGSAGMEALKTVASSAVGPGLIEYAVTHWPSTSGPATLHNFVVGNLLVLVLVSAFVAVRARHDLPWQLRSPALPAAYIPDHLLNAARD